MSLNHDERNRSYHAVLIPARFPGIQSLHGGRTRFRQ